jgi:hypothetical protein
MKERELALAPKPLSGIAQKSPLPASSKAEKPPTGCVAPGAGAGSVLITPANGAANVASAGRIARASSLGSEALAVGASRSVRAAEAVMSRLMPGT